MNRLRIFFQDCRGNILITMAPFIFVMLLLIGGFLDFGMGNINRAETLGAIDSAALAAAVAPDTSSNGPVVREDVARRYYDANTVDTVGKQLEFDELNFEISDNAGVKEVDVSAVNSIQSNFLKVGQIDSINTSARTRVVGGGTNSTVLDADIVLIDDLSGSMRFCDDSNIIQTCSPPEKQRGYQVAEKTRMLLDTLYPEDGDGGRVERPEVRTGIVTFKEDIFNYYGATGDYGFPGASLRASYSDAMSFIDLFTGNSDMWGAVGGMKGYTCGECGMRGAIDLFEQAPIRPDGQKNSPVKIAIFLTDGWIWNPCPPGDPCNSDSMYKLSVLDYAGKAFVKQCDLAKQDNIIVYTIAYGPDFLDTTSAEAVNVHQNLENCASSYVDADGVSRRHFYVATDSPELERVMRTVIPGHIQQLRIVQ